jgi:hypothetical protein
MVYNHSFRDQLIMHRILWRNPASGAYVFCGSSGKVDGPFTVLSNRKNTLLSQVQTHDMSTSHSLETAFLLRDKSLSFLFQSYNY